MKYILVLNSGSETLKCRVFERKKLDEKFNILVERIGLKKSFLTYYINNRRNQVNFSSGIKDHKQALKEVIKILPDEIYKNLEIIGHRIVHGGEDFVKPTLLNKQIISKLEVYNKFSPIHNPINIKCIKAAISHFPRLKHIAVFDTLYFKDLAEHIYLYSIPFKYYEYEGIRKYGFHGLSHEYMYQQACLKLNKRNLNVISCHLGSGASITAVVQGKVLDTTMGLTPLAGLTMSTRSGDLDPSIPLYLIKNLKMEVSEVDNELNFNSGLKGLYGTSDLREVLIAGGQRIPGFKVNKKYSKHKKELAKLVIKMYLYNIQRYVASYAGLLGKVDALIFSGGVGERNQYIRNEIINNVNFIIKPKVLIVKANEELVIAGKCKNY